jgi:hypothetical protein
MSTSESCFPNHQWTKSVFNLLGFGCKYFPGKMRTLCFWRSLCLACRCLDAKKGEEIRWKVPWRMAAMAGVKCCTCLMWTAWGGNPSISPGSPQSSSAILVDPQKKKLHFWIGKINHKQKNRSQAPTNCRDFPRSLRFESMIRLLWRYGVEAFRIRWEMH